MYTTKAKKKKKSTASGHTEQNEHNIKFNDVKILHKDQNYEGKMIKGVI